jgi:hypothetical protein
MWANPNQREFPPQLFENMGFLSIQYLEHALSVTLSSPWRADVTLLDGTLLDVTVILSISYETAHPSTAGGGISTLPPANRCGYASLFLAAQLRLS